MMLSGSTMILSATVGLVLRMPEIEEQRDPDLVPSEPDVQLEVSGRSGPVILTIEYRVRANRARAFYTAMLDMEPIRHRTGAYAWSLSRDVGDPELWIERYHIPTWHDYLRQRSRLTAADVALWDRALAFPDDDGQRVRGRQGTFDGDLHRCGAVAGKRRRDCPHLLQAVLLPSPDQRHGHRDRQHEHERHDNSALAAGESLGRNFGIAIGAGV